MENSWLLSGEKSSFFLTLSVEAESLLAVRVFGPGLAILGGLLNLGGEAKWRLYACDRSGGGGGDGEHVGGEGGRKLASASRPDGHLVRGEGTGLLRGLKMK